LVGVVLFPLLEDQFVQGAHDLLVEVLLITEIGLGLRVVSGGEGLVKGIVPDNVGVACEPFGDFVPEIDEFLLKLALRIVKFVVEVDALRHSFDVVLSHLLTHLNSRVFLHGFSQVELGLRGTEAQEPLHLRVIFVTVVVQTLEIDVKVWDSNSTEPLAKVEVVAVEGHMDAVLTQLVHHLLQSVKVVAIIEAGIPLEGLPRDTYFSKVDSPVLQVSDVLIADGCLLVKAHVCGNIRRVAQGDVDSVQNNFSAGGVDEHSVEDVYAHHFGFF
jgi:hypothetical protein